MRFNYILHIIKNNISVFFKRCYNWFILPKVGKKYHFFDDGKISESRHYIAECIKKISPKEAKNIIFNISPNDYLYPYSENQGVLSKSLYDIWYEIKNEDYWLYKDSTDYFVCCRIEDYDDDDNDLLLWFVRTYDNHWFSLDINNNWICGLLDVDNSANRIYEKTLNYI